jgi:hypothetical protein
LKTKQETFLFLVDPSSGTILLNNVGRTSFVEIDRLTTYYSISKVKDADFISFSPISSNVNIVAKPSVVSKRSNAFYDAPAGSPLIARTLHKLFEPQTTTTIVTLALCLFMSSLL